MLRHSGEVPVRPPRLRLSLSPRLWAAAFVLTSAVYLVHSDAEGISAGHWAPFAPLLHTSALSIFAVLAVLVAVSWGAIAGWLNEYEEYARAALDRACLLRATPPPAQSHPLPRTRAPRRLPGLALHIRPPPLTV
jgi:hypothetical protein